MKLKLANFVASCLVAVICSDYIAAQAAVLPSDVLPKVNTQPAKPPNKTGITYKVGYYDQKISHFHNTAFYQNTTFKQKYLINTDYFDSKSGNIFLYCGGESAVEGAWNHSRFVLDIAKDFKAMLLFIEHRFYGESLPATPADASFKPPYTDLLTVEQALADYATILRHIAEQYDAVTLPVLAFGGSYPGVLAAFMRIRYPQFVDGALAASAPLYTIASTNPLNNNTFFEVITNAAEEAVPGCSEVMRRNYAEIADLYASKQYQAIQERFQLCNPIATAKDYKQFLGFIQNAWASMAMANYPFPADFIGPMPAWPINTTCKAAVSMSSSMAGLAFSTTMFYNSSGTKKCFDTYADYYFCSDPTGCGLGNNARSWDLQACSELGLGSGPNGKTDMFAPMPWTRDDRAAYCAKVWGTIFDDKRLRYQFGEDDDFTDASRIIFSNGLLDPWVTGGIQKNLSDSLIALLIPQAAHHLDLWGATPGDPQSVIDARNIEIGYFRQWTNEQVRQKKRAAFMKKNSMRRLIKF